MGQRITFFLKTGPKNNRFSPLITPSLARASKAGDFFFQFRAQKGALWGPKIWQNYNFTKTQLPTHFQAIGTKRGLLPCLPEQGSKVAG